MGKIGWSVFVIGCFQESHFFAVGMTGFGRQKTAEKPGLEDDRHWAGLFGLGGNCMAVGPGRLAVHLVGLRGGEMATGAVETLLSDHIEQPEHCCSKLAVDPAAEELAGHPEE